MRTQLRRLCEHLSRYYACYPCYLTQFGDIAWVELVLGTLAFGASDVEIGLPAACLDTKVPRVLTLPFQ